MRIKPQTQILILSIIAVVLIIVMICLGIKFFNLKETVFRSEVERLDVGNKDWPEKVIGLRFRDIERYLPAQKLNASRNRENVVMYDEHYPELRWILELDRFGAIRNWEIVKKN
ncbi:MAG: hypothetical protein NTW79_03390 [Candidatus Berkelbacteria bacterium]|nr:hypothetical protein [Candidatus Berkelbacteria bacterium]